MTRKELEQMWPWHDHEYMEFAKIEEPRSKRPDLNALMLLDRLIPDDNDIIQHSSHDEISLGIDLDHLAAVADESNVIELIRSGIRLDTDHDCLKMFV